ncbi:hypothetical protein [Yinghuangia seranimata]|uniref:hypothetical protein n=1 Tax=Yinghuangia seranimata TaxID=408067 RepID=UPI00248A9B71|nr:hypothetical protein [Yinghuangia seranimata]MDI2129801.1 hypothetical protein [Yinghuangia seranimata]
MPVPLPTPDEVDLVPPTAEEVAATSRAIATAVAVDGELSAVQRLLLEALYVSMTGHPAAVEGDAIDARGLGELLRRRNAAFRGRILQVMLLGALVLNPLPEEVIQRVDECARELGVDDGMLEVARSYAHGNAALAAFDFERNGYTAEWDTQGNEALHTAESLPEAWAQAVDDPELAARWKALEELPKGTMGRGITDFYRARGFTYPGLPGSAPPLLAQHDWVHVLADYGTTVESELEVFAFIARANDDPRGFSLLAMVVSLFETGALATGAGLFEADPGHLAKSGMAVRVADAMRRGALCAGSNDFMSVDWFAIADQPIEKLRGHFCVPPKSADAVAAGAVGPWDAGGISPYQLGAGQELAAREGREYDSFGASVE